MPLPDASAITKLFELVTTSEAAIQLKEQFTAQAKKLGVLDKVGEALTALANFVDTIAKETSESGKSPWEGDKAGLLLTKLQHYNRALSDSLKAELNNDPSLANQKINFAFAINEQSQVQQGFSKDGQLLENRQLTALYDAWLTQNNMATDKNSVVSEVQADKTLQKMDAQKFAERVTDPQTGFQAFVNQEQKQVTVEVVQQKYREETVAPDASAG